MTSFLFSEVVTATRCPRQLVLLREGVRVVPAGASALGLASRSVLVTLAAEAPEDRRLLAALADRVPRPDAVRDACYRIAYRETHRRAMQLATSVSGSELSRLDSVTRSIGTLIATLLARARAEAPDARTAVARAILAADSTLLLEPGDDTIVGTAELLCWDAHTGLTWVWDLSTYAGADAARAEHVRLIAMACHAQGIHAAAAVLHPTEARVELVPSPTPEEHDVPELRERLAQMRAWGDGATPPPAPDKATCRACIAQGTCWSHWGRTLPDSEANGSDTPSALEDLLVDDAASRAPSMVANGAVPGESARDVGRSEPPAPLDPPPLWLGDDVAEHAPARIAASDLLHHIAVFGSSGAGKTWLARCLVEEAALAGIPVLALDLQGGLAQLARFVEPPAGYLAERSRALRDSVEVRVFTPGSDAGLRISSNPLRPGPLPADDRARGYCMGTIADTLLGAMRIPDAWGLVAKEYVAQLIGAAAADLTLAQLVNLVRDPSSLPIDPLLRSKTRRDALAEQLRTLATGPQRFLYDKGRRLTIDDVTTPTQPGRVPINVIWLGGLGDLSARQRFVSMVVAEVYAWMLASTSATPRLLLYLDEVAPFVPPHADPPVKGVLQRLFAEGRKHGVGGLFCTNNFTDVDYKVLSQAGTLALGRVNATQDKARARKLLSSSVAFDGASAADQLMSSSRGTFLVTRTARGASPRWVRLRPLLTAQGAPWTDADVMAHTPPVLRDAWRRGGIG